MCATTPDQSSRRAGYELEDASPRVLAWFIGVVAILLVLAALISQGIFGALRATQNPPGVVAPNFQDARPLPPSPRLQPDPLLDFEEFRDAQQNALNSYGWVDQQRGIAHIPIDQAMEMLLKQGLPTRQQQQKKLAPPQGGYQGTQSNRTNLSREAGGQ
jgi:hypothetical protein